MGYTTLLPVHNSYDDSGWLVHIQLLPTSKGKELHIPHCPSMPSNTWAETLAEIDRLADEVAYPPREELHAYLAPGKGERKEKGKGKGNKSKNDDPRQRPGEPWSRRNRRTQMQSVSEQDSTDPSMPELVVDDDDNDNADVRDVTVEHTADGREIIHA